MRGEVLLGVLNAFADGVGHFGGLANAKAHNAVAVAHNHQGGELHHAAALNGLGYTVDSHNPLLQVQGGSVNITSQNHFLLT